MLSTEQFHRITSSRYHAMEKRFAKQWTHRGRVVKGSEVLPFSLDEFRKWLIDRLGGIQGVTRCEYCNQPIDLNTTQLDHRLPPAQGGALGFENLAFCCAACNQQKGGMSAVAFIHLLNLVNDSRYFSEQDRVDCLGRLQIALKLAKRVNSHARHQLIRYDVRPHSTFREAPNA